MSVQRIVLSKTARFGMISREEKRVATGGHDELDVVNDREAHFFSRSMHNTRDAS